MTRHERIPLPTEADFAAFPHLFAQAFAFAEAQRKWRAKYGDGK